MSPAQLSGTTVVECCVHGQFVHIYLTKAGLFSLHLDSVELITLAEHVDVFYLLTMGSHLCLFNVLL